MKAFLLFMIVSFNSYAQCVNEEKYEEDIRKNMRSVFNETQDTSVVVINDLKQAPKKPGIYIEQLSEDRIFNNPRPKHKNICPDRIIRLFHVLGQDQFSKCHAIVRSDGITYIHDLIFKNCVKTNI